MKYGFFFQTILLRIRTNVWGDIAVRHTTSCTVFYLINEHCSFLLQIRSNCSIVRYNNTTDETNKDKDCLIILMPLVI